MKFDIISDLHVDQWNDFQYDWKTKKVNNNVIIAGDLADDLDIAINELNKACEVYDNVLYVDGNHESTNHFDNLEYVNDYINENVKYDNFYNLSNRDFVCEDWVIVGRCGWWDFKLCEPYMSQQQSIENFDTSWSTQNIDKQTIVDNIIIKAYRDFNYLLEKVDEYRDYKICIVLHTVPIKELMSDNYPHDRNYVGHYGNSLMEKVIYSKNVKCCIFGHNHDAKHKIEKFQKVFINNARGRKNDFNRENYNIYDLDLNLIS